MTPREMAAVIDWTDVVDRCALADLLTDENIPDAIPFAREWLRIPDAGKERLGHIKSILLGTTINVVCREDSREGRYKMRKVDAHALAISVAYTAMMNESHRAWKVMHGGTVYASYGYPSQTDGVLAAAIYSPKNNTVTAHYWANRLSANGTTLRGVAALFGYPDLCDARVSQARKDRATETLFNVVFTETILAS